MGRVNQVPSIVKYNNEPLLRETIIDGSYVITKEANEKVKKMISKLPGVGDTDGWFPDMKQAEELTDNLPENYPFLLWLVTSNKSVSGEENNKSVAKYINTVLQTRVYVA